MLNPNIHIICGKCGCNHMFKYKINIEGNYNDDTSECSPSVNIICYNCGTLTGLEEIIEEEK